MGRIDSVIGAEMYLCLDCKLAGDWTPEGTEYWTMPNGNSMTFQGVGTIPLHSDFVPCPKHKVELLALQSARDSERV